MGGLFAGEEQVLEECVELLTTVSKQVGVEDRWVWKLHSSHCYTVSSAYHSLTDDIGLDSIDNSSIVNSHF